MEPIQRSQVGWGPGTIPHDSRWHIYMIPFAGGHKKLTLWPHGMELPQPERDFLRNEAKMHEREVFPALERISLLQLTPPNVS